MGKTPVYLAVGLVVGAVAIVWLNHSPDSAEDSSGPALAGNAVPDSEQAALADRITDLELQVSALTSANEGLALRLAQEAERADSENAELAALIRDLQQRLAMRPNSGPGPSAGGPPVVTLPGPEFERQSFIIQSNGAAVRLLGPNGVITAETVAAAAASGQPMTAPPTLTGVQANPGQTLVFRVTGTNEGTVWGSDVYTDDSSIGAAAVHAGILRPGETGTIMVTVQDGNESYAPSSRNGIESESYGTWERSFTMLRLN